MSTLSQTGVTTRLVSVIIPTRNRSALLREAIESVLRVERQRFDLEVIVVDDASDDDTAAVAASYPVVYLRTEGVGPSRARNAGLRVARGEFLAFLDDDDVWLPDNVGTQLALLDAHPEYGGVIAQVQLTDARRTPYGEPEPRGPSRSGWIFEDLLNHPVQLGSVVLRRSVYEELGGLDPEIRYGEDWEWMLRMARRVQLGRVARPVVLFRQRSFADAAYVSEHVEWAAFRTIIRVFRRATRHCGPVERMRMQRSIWKRRGWYAALFLQKGRDRMRFGDPNQVLRCLYFALRASPAHFVVLLARDAYQSIATGQTTLPQTAFAATDLRSGMEPDSRVL